MEEEIKMLIKEISEELSKNVIGIVYNPKRPEGIKEEDCRFLRGLFDKNSYRNPVFILNGPGGDISPGISFPYIIKNAVKNYEVYIPKSCCSALCYTLLKADKLLIGENTRITQIDPTFEYMGEVRRAIKVMKDNSIKDPVLKDFAREAFHFAEAEVKKLIDKPSLFREKEKDYFEFMQDNDFVSSFMNKEEHHIEISTRELSRLGAKIENLKGLRTDFLANKFVQLCQDFAIQNNVRVIFVSSIPIKIEGEKEGVLICPLS